MRSSARPGWPDGVAKTTSCPAADSTCQLTATSVGSKSHAGNGIRTVTIGATDITDGPRRPGRRYVFGMVDTDAAPPQPLFSPEDGIADLWVKAYQGEVLGEILFGGIAAHLDDPDQAAKMRVLATLERRTKEAAAPGARAGRPVHRSRPRDAGHRRRRSCPARSP